MAKPIRRRCAICRSCFHPKYDNIEWCSPEHGAELGVKRRQKDYEKAQAKLKKNVRKKKKNPAINSKSES